ncbi:MAG: hypothetical protein HY962_09245 [Ignavibacteriae bacterium]|nr:hypothetical protein [Ignavibacteriota bacterium]
MSGCTMDVLLEAENAEYLCGDTVRGIVAIRALEPVLVLNISLDARWETSGQGIAQNGGTEQLHLDEECRLAANEERQWPFELQLPPSPAGYEGELFSVRWELHAVADTSPGSDPEITIPIRVHAPPGAGDTVLGPAYDPESVMDEQPLSPAANTSRLIIAGCLVGGFLIFVGYMTGDWRYAELSRLIGPIALISVGVLVAVGFTAGAISAMKRGRLEAAIENPFVQRGDALHATVRYTAGRTQHVEELVLRVEARESVTVRTGSLSNLCHHTLFELERMKKLPEILSAGSSQEMRASISIPSDIKHTYAVSYNIVEWRLVARLVPSRGAPVERVYPFVVLP